MKFIKRLPNEILMNNLLKSNLLLLFNDYNLMGTKIYNYLVTKRKILLCFKNDEFANNLKKNFIIMKIKKISIIIFKKNY